MTNLHHPPHFPRTKRFLPTRKREALFKMLLNAPSGTLIRMIVGETPNSEQRPGVKYEVWRTVLSGVVNEANHMRKRARLSPHNYTHKFDGHIRTRTELYITSENGALSARQIAIVVGQQALKRVKL